MISNPRGVGLHYLPGNHDEIFNGEIDFFEITPEYFVTQQGQLRHVDKIRDLANTCATTLHGAELSMCSGMALPTDFIIGAAELKRQLGAAFYSEHLSFMKSETQNSDLYLPPIYNEEGLEKNGEKVKEITDVIQSRFHLENVAGMIISPFDTISEGKYFHSLCRSTGCGLMLNLDSLIISSKIRQVDLRDFAMTFPLDMVTSITLVPRQSMNLGLERFFGDDVDREILNLLSFILKRTPARSVTVERRLPETTLEKLRPYVSEVREIFERTA